MPSISPCRRATALFGALSLLAALGLGGCRGGGGSLGGDDATPAPTDAHTGGGTDADGTGDAGADPGDGGAPAACDQAQPAFTCPSPDGVDFPLEGSGFQGTPADFASSHPEFKYRGDDLLTNEVGAVALAGRMARGRGLATSAYASEWVGFFTWDGAGHFDTLGRSQTDADGNFSLSLATNPGFGAGNHDVFAVLKGDGSCERLGVFSWPRGTEVILTDIDGTLTLSDGELLRQISDPSYDPQAFPDANTLMKTWRGKGYQIVYLTARPHDFRIPTDLWLRQHNFPVGPIITADSLVFNESARTYKSAAIGHLQNDLGYSVVVAYGNALSDVDAYADNGLPVERTFIIAENAGAGGTQPVTDASWSAHLSTFVASFRDASTPLGDAPFCQP